MFFFFQKFKPFGVSDSLGERIHIISVGHVKLIFQKYTKHATTIVFIDPREKFGKQECGSL